MLFIYDVHKEGGRDDHKTLAILQMIVDGVLGEGFFLTLLTSANRKSKSFTFHHKFVFTFFNF